MTIDGFLKATPPQRGVALRVKQKFDYITRFMLLVWYPVEKIEALDHLNKMELTF